LLATFHEAARSELAEAMEFYNERASGLGDSLGVEVYAVVAGILENPHAGFVVRPKVRRRLLPHFPYSLLYEAEDGRVRILAVMHHRRDPSYWSNRE